MLPITTVTAGAKAFKLIKAVPLAAWLGIGLGLSLWLNLHQYGKLSAADETCRADTNKAVLDAVKVANDEHAKAQGRISTASAVENHQATEKLADIAGRANRAANKLESLYRASPQIPVDAPHGDCYLPTEWVQLADDSLSTATGSRPKVRPALFR